MAALILNVFLHEDVPDDRVAGRAKFSVELIELLGARRIVTFACQGMEFKGVFEQRHLQRFREDVVVDLAFSRDDLHVIARSSGQRL